MFSLFLIKVLISFVIAGIWISTATYLAERFGSKIGGLITNLPSNIVISLVFIALVNDIDFVIQTIPAIPIGMAIDTLFLAVYIILLPMGIIRATLLSLVFWFVTAFLMIHLSIDNLFLNVLIYFAITVAVFFIIHKYVALPAQKKSKISYTLWQMLIRAFFAGGMVASVVFISHYLNAYMVGIFSTFPAVLLSTMIILGFNQNIAFARATGKILILSSSNIIIYAVCVNFSFPSLGIIWGSLISFLCAFIWVWLFHPFLKKLS